MQKSECKQCGEILGINFYFWENEKFCYKCYNELNDREEKIYDKTQRYKKRAWIY